jgi:hypothetical protein
MSDASYSRLTPHWDKCLRANGGTSIYVTQNKKLLNQSIQKIFYGPQRNNSDPIKAWLHCITATPNDTNGCPSVPIVRP